MDPLAVLFERFAARGDVAALGEVFDRTAKHLLHLAMHLAHSAEDAEDLLQATFVLAMKKAGTFSKGGPLLPWLSGILAGEARNLARRNQHRRAEPLPDLVDTEGGPIASAERGELVARLRARVEDLPPEQRQTLLLQLQHGLSPTDIAEVLDVPPGTVRMRLHRGLQALRRLLPSALAVWLFGALPTRGLAAVRAAVMREAGVAHAAPIGGAAAVAAGALSMKYVFAGAAVLFAALFCWWINQPAPITTLAAPAHDTTASVTDANARAAVPTAPERVVASEAVALPSDGTSSLRVHATSASSGRPLVNLAIRIWPGPEKRSVDGTARVLRTDAGGVVRFDALAPGEWQVESLGSHEQACGVQLAAGTEAQHALALAARPLQGIVVDENGNPVAGASIRVGTSKDPTPLGNDPTRPDVSLAAFVRTAAVSAGDGTFACDAGDDEPYVAAAHASYASSHTQLTQVPGLIRWRLVLHAPTRELRGVVLDSSRQPITGASIAARVFGRAQRTADGTWFGPVLVEFAETGADGRFVFGMLPPGNARLDATAPGRQCGSAVTAKAADDVEIVLRDGTYLVGTVHDADGTPFRSGYVHVRRGADRVMLGQAFVRDGRFAFRELPRPPFTIQLFGPGSGFPVLERRIEEDGAAVTHVEFVVPATPALGGVVVDDRNRPLANWTVAAYRPDAPRGTLFVESTKTDAEGRFTLRHLRDERLRVVATWPAGDPANPAVARDDVSPSGGELVLRVPAGRQPQANVSGRLLDGAGSPIARTSLSLTLQVNTKILHTVATGGDGAFRIERVPAGDYALSLVIGDEPPRTLRNVHVDRDAPVELGDVRALPLATLRVDIVRVDGTPWHEMLPDVWLTDAEGNTRTWLPKLRDDGCEGRVEPGPVRIQVTDPDLIAQTRDVELMPGERRVVRIAVTVGRSTSLVFAGDGDFTQVKIDPNDRLHVEVLDKGGTVVLREEVRRSPHGDGNWTLEHTFPFGEYTVTARTDSDRRYRGTFVAADAMPTRSIDVPRQP